jgi:hypothetical protein
MMIDLNLYMKLFIFVHTNCNIMQEDIELMAKVGFSAYQFSIAPGPHIPWYVKTEQIV